MESARIYFGVFIFFVKDYWGVSMTQFIADTLLAESESVMKIDLETKQIRIYKLHGKLMEGPKQEIDGVDLLKHGLANGRVIEEDLWQFETLLSTDDLLNRYLLEKKGSTMVYRREEEEGTVWYRGQVMLGKGFGESNRQVLYYNTRLNYNETAFYESYATLSQNIHKVIRLNLSRDT